MIEICQHVECTITGHLVVSRRVELTTCAGVWVTFQHCLGELAPCAISIIAGRSTAYYFKINGFLCQFMSLTALFATVMFRSKRGTEDLCVPGVIDSFWRAYWLGFFRSLKIDWMLDVGFFLTRKWRAVRWTWVPPYPRSWTPITPRIQPASLSPVW